MNQAASYLREQRAFFASGVTRRLPFRLTMLRRLYRLLSAPPSKKALLAALLADLGKERREAVATEYRAALGEIRCQITRLAPLSAPRAVLPSLPQLGTLPLLSREPLGCVLILTPRTEPLAGAVCPLATAMAAGNTVTLKLSSAAPHTAAVLGKLLSSAFPLHYLSLLPEPRDRYPGLLTLPYDLICLQGSRESGKAVLRSAAENLTPALLSLGGKCPCVVDETADLDLCARRILRGKLLCGGKSPTAPDFIYCDRKILPLLVGSLVVELKKLPGYDPIKRPYVGHAHNREEYLRLMELIDEEKIVIGGHGDPETLGIAPTILSGIRLSDPIMREEILGPILPIVTYERWEEVIPTLRALPKPPALYLFSRSRAHLRQALSSLSFGGGCINEVGLQTLSPRLPHGGIGDSGMGQLHGRFGYEAFSRPRPLLLSLSSLDSPLRPRPVFSSADADDNPLKPTVTERILGLFR